MGDNSGIEWLQRFPGVKGATWNVNRGCSEVDEGCEDCYAKYWAAMPSMSGDPSKPYHGLVTKDAAGVVRWTGQVRFVEAMLDQPLKWKSPRLIFTNSMSDWLHSRFQTDEVIRVVDVMRRADHHVFMCLTRRTQRLMDVSTCAGLEDLPAHIWVGVTIPSRQHLFRLAHLKRTRAKTRWVSFEPLLGDIGKVDLAGIHWAVIGGLSGRGKLHPMHSLWVRRLIEQCQAQGVAVFFKQWGRTCPINQLPPDANYKMGKTPVIIVDDGGTAGLEADKARRPEMHVITNKDRNGRHFDGKLFDGYPSLDHFPAKMRAYTEAMV